MTEAITVLFVCLFVCFYPIWCMGEVFLTGTPCSLARLDWASCHRTDCVCQMSARHIGLALFVSADYHGSTAVHEGLFWCQQKLKTNELSGNILDKALSCLQNDIWSRSPEYANPFHQYVSVCFMEWINGLHFITPHVPFCIENNIHSFMIPCQT